MIVVEKGIATLLRSAMTGEKLPLPEGFCLNDILPMVRKHGIVTLVYKGAVQCGVDTQHPVMQQLFQSYCRLMLQSEAQMRVLQQVFSRFEAGNIDYMPLKGCKLKAMYPAPELRLMGDADILIREDQYPGIAPIMEKLGFSFRKETDHEIVWERKELYLELHKRLIPSNNVKFNGHFKNGWDLALRQQGSRFCMTAEDEYLYLFTHFTKHYLDGGIGCRHVTDLWVYRQKNPGLDEQKLSRELRKLGLLDFYENVRNLMAVWFEDAPADDRTDFLTDRIFSSGSWGSLEQQALAQGVRKQKKSTGAAESKIRYFTDLIFPRRSVAAREYHWLNRFPWLLPYAWLLRIIKKFRVGIHWKKHYMTMNVCTQENLDDQRAMLEYVGLNDRY